MHRRLLAALAFPGVMLAQPAIFADHIITNGKIVTADSRFSMAQAVAIRDGKFLAVGSNEQIAALAGPGTVRTDARGHMILPGLIDTHAHVAAAGNEGSTVSFSGVTSIPEALGRIQAWVAKTRSGEWITGSNWNPLSQLREQRFLTRREIDGVAPGNPVFLPTVGHFAMANSEALSIANVGRVTPEPVGGVIERDANGEPNGVLEESAISLVSDKIPAPSLEVRAQRMKAAMGVFNSYGLTSVVDGGGSADQIGVYQTVWARHEMTLRVGAMFMPASGATSSVEDWEKTFRNLVVSSGFGDEWLQLAGIGEMGVDGGMTLKTALLRESYPSEPGNYGFASIPADKLNQLAEICNRYGWRLGLHAVGDAAIDRALDAFEHADSAGSIRDKRFSLIHASLITSDQLKRAAKLGVRVDLQNVFMWDKARTVAGFIGGERANRAVPVRLVIDTLGIDSVGAGTDFPVNTMNPFINLYIMITRRDPDGKVWGQDQAITREEAVRLYTSSAARFTFEETRKGSIEPGKLADLAIISDDLLTIPADRIKDIRVLATMVGGTFVYQPQGLAEGVTR